MQDALRDTTGMLLLSSACSTGRSGARLVGGTISLRDKMDTTRKNAPLACPDGALVIDTGRHSIDQVVGMVLDLAEKARS